jgi:hypothetical protein
VFPLKYEQNSLDYLEEIQSLQARVEADSNTSTVALRVVGGHKKEPCARGYN